MDCENAEGLSLEQVAQLLVNRAVKLISEAEPGTVTTMHVILNTAAAAEGISLDALEENDDFDIFELDCTIRDRIDDAEEVFLDNLSHYGKEEGLPYNLDFVIRRKIRGEHLRSEDLLRGLESFRFYIGGFFQGSEEIVLVQEGGQWVAVVDISDHLYTQVTVCDPVFHPSDRQVDALIDGLTKAHALNWEDRYWEPVLDGTQWELKIGLADGLAFVSHGSNVFPEGFRELALAIEQLGLPLSDLRKLAVAGQLRRQRCEGDHVDAVFLATAGVRGGCG